MMIPCAILLLLVASLVVGRIQHVEVDISQDDIGIDGIHIRMGPELTIGILSETSGMNYGLNGVLGASLPPEFGIARKCMGREGCLHWDWHTMLTIKKYDPFCYNITWESKKQNTILEDCYSFGSAHWYGGGENRQQLWPVERLNLSEMPYVTLERDNQAVLDRYWLNSDGFYIHVDRNVPLWIDTNNHRPKSICFVSKQFAPYRKRDISYLSYMICSQEDLRRAHMHAVNNFLPRPKAIPDTRMVQDPIWSTWVQYRKNVNRETVLLFAKNIKFNGFNNSQIEIDDNWETCYGSAKFNKSRFPDMKNFTDLLKSLGYRVTLWVHPFVNIDCPESIVPLEKGYFIKNLDGNTETIWWDGKARIVDFTNPEATKWYVERLHNMMHENGIDGLKFDAGEISWAPQVPRFKGPVEEQPEIYSRRYAETASRFGPLTEVRVGTCTQDLPIFVRMIDKDSHWGINNGLPSLLTTAFQMNIAGYPFVLPDMVGGNAYGDDKVTKELFIRWLQANTFLPAVQISIVPWDYDTETVDIAKKFTALHAQYAPTIIGLMKEAVRIGQPINMPIWWVDPKDETSHSISDEYMLGDNTLVAPVMKENARSRSIYFPRGYWRDENDPQQKVYRGRTWVQKYPVPLNVLPYFSRIIDEEANTLLDAENENIVELHSPNNP